LEVWAPDLPGLLNQAALGMQTLSGMRLEAGQRQVRTLSLEAIDAESALVRFLSELLWLAEQDRLGFDTFDIKITGQGAPIVDLQKPLHLEVSMEGAPIAGLDKEIKAVTYHNLAVLQTGNGLEAHIVFDV
jgi:SHS2 domain-containing protein